MKHADTATRGFAEHAAGMRKLRVLAGLLACYGLAGFAWWNTLGCSFRDVFAGVITTSVAPANAGSVAVVCNRRDSPGAPLSCPQPQDEGSADGYYACLTPSDADFSHWSETCGCTDTVVSGFDCNGPNQCLTRVVPNIDVECVANFCNAFELSIEVAGTGRVSTFPEGIFCPGGNCRSSFCDVASQGSALTIELYANPRTGSGETFAGWEGDPDCTDGLVSLDADKSCRARFRPPVFSISVSGAGRVTGLPSFACREDSSPFDCNRSTALNGFVTLEADPDPGAQLLAWGGDCPDGASTSRIVMSEDRTCTVTFSESGTGGADAIEILSLADDESLGDGSVFIEDTTLAGSSDLAVVAFRSQATNLTGAPEPSWCAYTRDREAGTTQRINGPAYVISAALSVSADGSFAAFENSRPDPVLGVVYDIHRRDLRVQTDELISVDFPVSTDGGFPVISGNGRYVAYRAKVDVTHEGIVVRDTCSGALPAPACVASTVVVSRDPGGALLVSLEGAPRISRDGRFVLFRGIGESASVPELFLHDRDVDGDGLFDEPGFTSTIFATPDPAGGVLELYFDVRSHDLDASGRYVAFQSTDLDLPGAGGVAAVAHSFLRDTCAGAPAGCVPSYTMLSVRQDGTPVDNSSFVYFSDLSGSGRFAVFYTADALMVGSDASAFVGRGQIVLRDTCVAAPAGCTPGNLLVSRLGNGSPLPGFNYMPRVSDDGGAAVFFGWRQSVVASPNPTNDEVLFAQTGIPQDTGLQPGILGRSPSRAPAGSPELIVTINGSYFAPAARVRWSGVARPATFISPQKLQIRLSPADLATAGAFTFLVENPGGLTSNQVSFVVD